METTYTYAYIIVTPVSQSLWCVSLKAAVAVSVPQPNRGAMTENNNNIKAVAPLSYKSLWAVTVSELEFRPQYFVSSGQCRFGQLRVDLDEQDNYIVCRCGDYLSVLIN